MCKKRKLDVRIRYCSRGYLMYSSYSKKRTRMESYAAVCCDVMCCVSKTFLSSPLLCSFLRYAAEKVLQNPTHPPGPPVPRITSVVHSCCTMLPGSLSQISWLRLSAPQHPAQVHPLSFCVMGSRTDVLILLALLRCWLRWIGRCCARASRI